MANTKKDAVAKRLRKSGDAILKEIKGDKFAAKVVSKGKAPVDHVEEVLKGLLDQLITGDMTTARFVELRKLLDLK